MKKLWAVLIFVLSLLPGFCQAQLNGVDLSSIEATTPLTVDQMPLYGTFYSAAHPQMPPMPVNILGLSGWSLDNGYYLLDDLDSSPSGRFHAMDEFGLLLPSSDEGSVYEFTNSVTPYAFPTNGLWLWITNVSNETVHANLNGATDFVYEIFSTTNLMAVPAVSDWNIETEVFPGTNTNTMPFTVPTAGRNPLFLWARDWTGITSNGNTTPDWWFWMYFGTTGLNDTNLDSYGNTLLSDYQTSTDPNIIQFNYIEISNEYCSNSNVPMQLDILGAPYYIAILVDDTNFDDAAWNTFTSTNISLNLGTREGWHSVWVGLRGYADDVSIAQWQWRRFKLDFTPPILVFTGATNSTVDIPMIQLTGYSPEDLSTISYDITNSAGLLTNQQISVTDRFFDTNRWEFTTNAFQGYDIFLTNGLNIITVRAADLAGNVTMTNLNYTLDYTDKTNLPVVQLIWPTNGTLISGSNFNLDGQLADPTATAHISITDTNGDTNRVAGLVGRSGEFWVQNIPLSPGTNKLTLTVVDVVGNTTTTNITLVQSPLMLAVDPVDSQQLWQPTINLTGTISDATYAVWVNGVKGTNNGDGTWAAQNVPVDSGGTASFTVTAYSPDETQPDGSHGN